MTPAKTIVCNSKPAETYKTTLLVRAAAGIIIGIPMRSMIVADCSRVLVAAYALVPFHVPWK